MFCKNCGKRLDYQETVCPRCGKKVEEQEKSSEKIQEQVYPVSKKWFIISFLVLPCVFGIWCTTIGVHYYPRPVPRHPSHPRTRPSLPASPIWIPDVSGSLYGY